MKKTQRTSTLLFLASVGCVATGLTSFAAQANTEQPQIVTDEQDSAQTLRWRTRQIPVCWENPSPEDQKARELVERSVAKTWGVAGSLNFLGWDRCADDARGIRILIDNSAAPGLEGLGFELDGVPGGMSLNFSASGCEGDLDACIQASAIDQFGVALGIRAGGQQAQAWSADPFAAAQSYSVSARADELTDADIEALGHYYPQSPLQIRVKLPSGVRRWNSKFRYLGFWRPDSDGGVDSRKQEAKSSRDKLHMFYDRDSLYNIAEVRLVATRSGREPSPPDPWNDWILVGYWDVDRDGAVGTDGPRTDHRDRKFNWNAGLFVRLSDRFSYDQSLLDIKLVASNNGYPAREYGYKVVGYWDVKRSAQGSHGTRGHHMMTLLAKYGY